MRPQASRSDYLRCDVLRSLRNPAVDLKVRRMIRVVDPSLAE
jgi:hypothetical protein